MPRIRPPTAAPSLPVRVSPRKRKQIDESPDAETPVLTKTDHELVSVESEDLDIKPTKRGRNKTATRYQQAQSDSALSKVSPISKVEPKTVESASSEEISSAKPKSRATIKRKSNPATVKAEENNETDQEDHSNVDVTTITKVVVKQDGNGQLKKPIRKRKTKEEKAAEAMPLAARTPGLKMFVGAHVSIAKGVENAVTNCVHIGGNAFALFLKSQRKWDNPALKEENREAFKQQCVHHKYDPSAHVVPHGSYLVNLASPDKDMSKKSYDTFVDDLRRCEAMGIKYYNFHPGSTNKEPLDEAIGRLAGNLNRALAETSTVTPLLENMAGHGSIIGSRFTDLRDIIAAIKPEHRSRIGVCIDTCHAFAAGYDLRTPASFKNTFELFDKTVGLKYLKAMHINDSKAPFNSHRDLHQNIGLGFLGLRAFHNVMNDERLQDIPLVLETPCERPDPENPKKAIDDKNVWAREIKLLESLIGMDPEGIDFKKLEADLSEEGRMEREKMEASAALRDEKARKKAQREAEKGQKSISAMLGGKGKKRQSSVSSSSSLSDADSEA